MDMNTFLTADPDSVLSKEGISMIEVLPVLDPFCLK
jgi:hypothetical protein